MKKSLLVALAVVALCSVFLAGTVSAAKEGYGFQISQGAEITADGAVSPATEWDDSYKDFLYDGWTMTTSSFRCKWGSDPAISEGWLIEILGDTTDDAGDIFRFTVDNGIGFGDPPTGGAAPSELCFKIEVSGTGGVETFIGDGSGWVAHTGSPAVDTDYIIARSMATGHVVIEMWLAKQGALALGLSNNMRMCYTDASTGQTIMWPPDSSPDVPDSYGTGETLLGADPIPEGLTVAVMLSLSTVAVLVSTRYFRKPRI